MIEEINPGDLCIVQDNNFLYFVVVKENFKEDYYSGSIESIFVLTYDQVLYTSCCILYKFDGVTSRKGNRTLINLLLNLSLSDELNSFFEDIMQILLYREHKLNVQNLMRLFSLNSFCVSLDCKPEREEHPENLQLGRLASEQQYKNEKIQKEASLVPLVKPRAKVVLDSHNPNYYIFYDYLSDDYKELWSKLFQEGKNTRECLTEIKKINKNYFNAVLSKFKIDNPSENIYSLNNNHLCQD